TLYNLSGSLTEIRLHGLT
nr:hypothetical protein [Tanacetum cinerariifolium]